MGVSSVLFLPDNFYLAILDFAIHRP
jgi:hypothetical protein